MACGRVSDTPESKSCLYPAVSLGNELAEPIQLSSIFPDFRLIGLETNDDCLVGRNTKIIKQDSLFFIRSNNELLVFNNDGKYLKKLSSCGAGPEEYANIRDFEILDDHNEIWICDDNRSISRYDLGSFDFKGKLTYDFGLFSIKYLGDDLIVANTSDEEGIFKVINTSGDILDSSFKNDMANTAFSIVDFVYSPSNRKFIHNLQNSNDVIYCDLDSMKLGAAKLIESESNILTAADNLRAMNEQGYMEQMAYVAKNYIQIAHVSEIDDTVIMILCYPGNKWKMLISKGGESVIIPYFPEDINLIENDIIDNVHPLTFNTLVCGDSDDSFLFLAEVGDTEDNPYIIEVTGVNIPQ